MVNIYLGISISYFNRLTDNFDNNKLPINKSIVN
jgi:ribosomal protein S17E